MEGHRITSVVVRDRRLRWPVPESIENALQGQTILALRRRAKYLLLDTENGSALLHFGMSGSVRIINADEPAAKHDHFDIQLSTGKAMRYRDPRRFGSFLWAVVAEDHPLIRSLGPEPLEAGFDGDYLWKIARKRHVAIKSFIMNAAVVVGVGNIYASEALYLSGIHPKRQAARVSRVRMKLLADNIKAVLARAITAGGTTLRDFHGSDGEPGYFKQDLEVYGRAGEPCKHCLTPITAVVIGQRSSFYCKTCQT